MTIEEMAADIDRLREQQIKALDLMSNLVGVVKTCRTALREVTQALRQHIEEHTP